ncbi:unnamed protein product [Peniophora sp. CBMAI 1063]|nr:unnamed protein product [Peniophora sp. CBMAI 1063]
MPPRTRSQDVAPLQRASSELTPGPESESEPTPEPAPAPQLRKRKAASATSSSHVPGDSDDSEELERKKVARKRRRTKDHEESGAEDDEDEDELDEEEDTDEDRVRAGKDRKVASETELDEESGDEAPVVKRGRGRPPKTKTKGPPPAAAKVVTYELSIYTAKELKKAQTKRTATSGKVVLATSVSWLQFEQKLVDTVKTRLNKPTSKRDSFDFSIVIPRLMKSSGLNTVEDYEFAIGKLSGSKSGQIAHVTVNEVPNPATASEKREAIELSDDTDAGEKPKKPKKKGKTTKIYPSNDDHDERIATLRERHTCKSSTCGNGTSHCWVDPDTGAHTALGNQQLDAWAAAIPAGNASYTKPPNHRLFDPSVASPVREARRIANEAKGAPAVAPSVNIHFPSEFANALRPPVPPAPVGPAVVNNTGMLVPPGHSPGPSMSLEDFAALYDLHPDTFTALKAAKFRDAAELGHLSLAQCEKALDLALGQSANLALAVATWAKKE